MPSVLLQLACYGVSGSDYHTSFFQSTSFNTITYIYFSVSPHYNYRENIGKTSVWKVIPQSLLFLTTSLQIVLLLFREWDPYELAHLCCIVYSKDHIIIH